MKYDQLIIYYFSGTGNAKNAALWIIKNAKDKGLRTYLINIDRFKMVDVPELTERTLIGFCSATHGFNMPPIVLKFLFKFPKVKNVDSFIFNTRGGLKLYKYFIPGLSGVAQLLPALILRLKGFRIVGMQPLDLPSNWLLLHPGLKKKVINSIYKRCHSIVNNFATNMLDGKRKYKALLSLPVDLALIPISLVYYFFGRFFLAKTVDERPFWIYKCVSCMRCVNICPQRAVETTHGFSGLIIVVYVLLFPLLVTEHNHYL